MPGADDLDELIASMPGVDDLDELLAATPDLDELLRKEENRH